MTAGDSGRIPLLVFKVSYPFVSVCTGSQLTSRKGVNGTLFGLALLTATARMVIRYHSQRQLHPDDFVLMFACLTFIASQILLYVLKIEEIYWSEAFILDPNSEKNLAVIFEDPEAFYRRMSKIQRMIFASFALNWTSIYAVKICFLLFFHQMITRLRRLLLAWKVIFGITIFFWAFCICGTFIACPYFGPTASKPTLPPHPSNSPVLQHLTKRSGMRKRSSVHYKSFYEHHRVCPRYHVRLAP